MALIFRAFWILSNFSLNVPLNLTYSNFPDRSTPRHRRRCICNNNMERPGHPCHDDHRRVRDAPRVCVLRDQVRNASRYPAPSPGKQERVSCLLYQLVSFCVRGEDCMMCSPVLNASPASTSSLSTLPTHSCTVSCPPRQTGAIRISSTIRTRSRSASP